EGGRLELFYWERTLRGRVFEFRDPLLEDTAHSDDVEGLAVHPSGAVLATASDTEGKLKLWGLVNGQLLASVALSKAHGVAFRPDGGVLAVATDRGIAQYEVGGLREHTFVGRRGHQVRAMGLSGDGRLLGTIAALHRLETPDRTDVFASLWHPDGRLAD